MKKYLFFFAFIFALASMNAQVVWSDDFEDLDISDWSLYDEDGDGFEWSAVQLTDEFGAPVGTPILTSVSWSGIPLTPDNWAVSPAIDLTGASGDITLTWYVFASDPLYNLENYGVYVGTSNNVADLTAAGELFTEFDLPDTLTERTLDLSSFAGETIYVAFRHYDVSDQFRIGIDDVSVEIDGGGTGGDEYCGPITFEFGTEPISRVVFSNIDNPSSAETTSPGHEDFTDMVANVTTGEVYQISVEGNTGGAWEDFISVFIDWNQNGTLDDAGEVYEIGSIFDSTGEDGVQVLYDIPVPDDALEGETMMRVFKTYDVPNDSNIDPCAMDQNYGQVEDYTINVSTEGGGGGSECDQSFDGAFSLANSISGDLGYTVANDFVVAANNSMEIETLRLLLLPIAGSDADFDSFDVTLYSDNALTPGTPVTEATWLGLTGTSELHTETFAGYNTYWVTLEIPDYTIPANSTDTHYWIAVNGYSVSAQNIFWVGYDYVEGSPTASNYQSEDGGVTWTQITYDGVGDHYDSIWEMDATCELGVSDMNSFDFTYYPNPVKDYLTIDSKQQVASYSAHNLAGQTVVQGKSLSANGQINMSGLAPGVYVFRVTLEGGQIETFKVIKK